MVIGIAKLEMHIFANITGPYDRWVTWLDGYGHFELSNTLLKLVAIVLAMVGIKFYF